MDGIIYVGGDRLYAISPDGSLKWSYPERCEPPSIGADGTLFAPCYDGYDEGSLAVSPDGSLKWAYVPEDLMVTRGPCAIGADGTLYVSGRDPAGLYAMSATGSLLWFYDAVTTCPILPSPAVGADGTVYVVVGTGRFIALEREGVPRWWHGWGVFLSSAAIGADGTIYVGSDYDLYAIR